MILGASAPLTADLTRATRESVRLFHARNVPDVASHHWGIVINKLSCGTGPSVAGALVASAGKP
jgi:hypothetical protein